MTVGIIVAIVAVVLVVWFIAMYNGLVKLRNNRENAFANIDVQLKQRFDLVPQLVNTVKGYATHEKEVLEKVTAARAAAMNANTVDEKVAADKALSGALAGLRVSLEAYPELAKKMGEVSRKRAIDVFSWKSIAKQTYDFYQECIDRYKKEGKR